MYSLHWILVGLLVTAVILLIREVRTTVFWYRIAKGYESAADLDERIERLEAQ